MKSWLAQLLWWVARLIPESYVETLQLAKIFGRSAPLEVDLGCGDGNFLVARAQEAPERNFLGVDRMDGRVETALRRVERLRLDNVRLLQLESGYAVRYLLPPGSVTMFHLLFPDPWPKRRHWRRRVVKQEFLKELWEKLQPGGHFRVVTDDAAYFDAIGAELAGCPGFVEEPSPPLLPPTTFEQRFRDRGLPVYRLVLRKVAPAR